MIKTKAIIHHENSMAINARESRNLTVATKNLIGSCNCCGKSIALSTSFLARFEIVGERHTHKQ